MRALRRMIVLLGLGLLLAACSEQDTIDRFIPKEEAALAQDILARVAARDFASVEAQLDPGIARPAARASLQQMAAAFPAGQPTSIKTVGANTVATGSRTTYELTFEYQYPGAWLRGSVVLLRKDGYLTVLGLHVMPATRSLSEENRFTFEGKTPLHYIVFALAVAIPVFILSTLVVCARTPLPKRKWLWLLFVAVGFMQFSFNWTDGNWALQPLIFNFLGAGYARFGFYGPWVIKFGIPLGAIVFLWKHKFRGVPREAS